MSKTRLLLFLFGALGLLVSGAIVIIFFSVREERPTEARAIASTDFLTAGPFRVNVSVEPLPPIVGANTLTVRLRDGNDQPVAGAEIKAVAEMPAMGAMPAMRVPMETVEIADGAYRGRFNLPMAGEWPFTIAIEKPGLGSRTLGFDMATGRRGLRLNSGADTPRSDVSTSPPGTVTLDAKRRQLIGVELGVAQTLPLHKTLRAIGRVTYDETRLSDVSLKFQAWIGELKADYVGVAVNKGDVLFTAYGPDLLAAQDQYLEIRRRAGRGPLVEAARKRLLLWDMTPAQIETLERRGVSQDYVPILAMQSGTVIEKTVVAGTAVPAGKTILRIADLSHVWIEAEIYEGDLSLIREGMRVVVTLPYLPGERFEADVDYVYPYLDGKTRTGKIRLSLPNPDGSLKPDMYAEARLVADLGPRLLVPEEAVLVSGDKRIVFEDLGDGRLAPRRVQTGQANESYIEILDGLEEGARVVTSGNFLIASESKLKSGLKQW